MSINLKKFQNMTNLTTPFMGSTRGEVKHPGIDLAAPSGTLIPAFADGTITSARPSSNGMGNVVTLRDEGGNNHQYGHLQGALVRPGMRVRKGQPIAKMGKSGNSYSPSGSDPSHLDIRIVSAYGRFKNPLTYLNSFK
ncbi:MAG TPA: M23 family metallopeptidase [Candidatus Pacearchaeota archaeon]|nr:M23 family metallopeptidase [Candidatus Pacearchaeota archaeon]